MKKALFTAVLFLVGITAFCQSEETNGTIYIKHPYIDVVMKANNDYVNNDFSTVKNYYADTAKWWISGMDEFIPIADAVEMWKSDFEKFDSVKQTQVGYPDYFHYTKDDAKIVESYWIWSGISKKTGKSLKTQMVMFDEFNNDGKIVREYIIGDFSRMNE